MSHLTTVRRFASFLVAAALGTACGTAEPTPTPESNGTADAGTCAPPDAGAPRPGTLRFAVSIGNTRVTEVSATLDDVALSGFTAPTTGGAPTFTAGTADKGVEVTPGLHHFTVTVKGTVTFCRSNVGGCDGVDVPTSLTHGIDVMVRPDQEQSVFAVFRVIKSIGVGSEKLLGRIVTTDTSPMTEGNLAGVARLLLVREPSDLFDGIDTVKFGGKTIGVNADNDGIMLIPANAGGRLSVQMSGFTSGPELLGPLPAIPAGHVLPIIHAGTTVNIPVEHAGVGTDIVVQ